MLISDRSSGLVIFLSLPAFLISTIGKQEKKRKENEEEIVTQERDRKRRDVSSREGGSNDRRTKI